MQWENSIKENSHWKPKSEQISTLIVNMYVRSLSGVVLAISIIYNMPRTISVYSWMVRGIFITL